MYHGFALIDAAQSAGVRVVMPVQRRRWPSIFIHPSSFLIGMLVGGYIAGVSIWGLVLCK